MTTNDNRASLTDWDIAHGGPSLHVDWTMTDDGQLTAQSFVLSESAHDAVDLELTLVVGAPLGIIFDECA